jgi:hypothetical protein
MGFFLLQLTLLPEFLLGFIGVFPSLNLAGLIILLPGSLLPANGLITMLLIMFFWGSAGFLLGYVKDRRDAVKVITARRPDKNRNMTNPYIDKIIKNSETNSKKKGYTPRDWIIVISTIFCSVLIAFTVIFPAIMMHVTGHPHQYACSKVESDAQNTLAAIASYFSDPENTEVPTVQDLMNSEGLTIDKNSTVTVDGTIDRIRVAVLDNTKTCVRGNLYEVYMGGTSGEWYRE